MPAVAVDHVTAIAAGGAPFPPLDGLMSLCESCHSWKTNQEDRPDRRRKIGSRFKGCAVDGGPVDPNDDWNRPGADQGRSIDASGPAPNSNAELVANDSQEDTDRWV